MKKKGLINTHVFTEMKNEVIEICVAPGIKIHAKITGFFTVLLCVLQETAWSVVRPESDSQSGVRSTIGCACPLCHSSTGDGDYKAGSAKIKFKKQLLNNIRGRASPKSILSHYEASMKKPSPWKWSTAVSPLI